MRHDLIEETSLIRKMNRRKRKLDELQEDRENNVLPIARTTVGLNLAKKNLELFREDRYDNK